MPEEDILHQEAVEGVIAEVIADASDHGVIADPASPGASYVQAEVVALRTAIVAILDVLRDSELIPSA